MKPIRPPIKDDYTNSFTNKNNSTLSRLRPPLQKQNQNNNNPFQSQNNGPQFSNPNNTPSSSQNNRENNYNSSTLGNNQEKTQEDDKEQNVTPKHKTSQKHKTPESNYNINPNQSPRPNQYDEIYSNDKKLPYYETNIGTAQPHTTTFYSVIETQNSSCRYIRSTLNSVPISQSLLNETNLLFGICVTVVPVNPELSYQPPNT